MIQVNADKGKSPKFKGLMSAFAHHLPARWLRWFSVSVVWLCKGLGETLLTLQMGQQLVSWQGRISQKVISGTGK